MFLRHGLHSTLMCPRPSSIALATVDESRRMGWLGLLDRCTWSGTGTCLVMDGFRNRAVVICERGIQPWYFSIVDASRRIGLTGTTYSTAEISNNNKSIKRRVQFLAIQTYNQPNIQLDIVFPFDIPQVPDTDNIVMSIHLWMCQKLYTFSCKAPRWLSPLFARQTKHSLISTHTFFTRLKTACGLDYCLVHLLRLMILEE